MKLAASDYDGTLFRHREVAREDVEAIHAWRRAGNYFGLATGRDLSLCVVEIEAKHLELDFIVCNTGGGVYTFAEAGAIKPLQVLELPEGAAAAALAHPITQQSFYLILCGDATSWVLEQNEGSWITSLGLPLTPITRDEVPRLKRLQQISLEYKTPAESALAAQILRESFANEMTAQSSGCNVDIVAKGVNKAGGIEALLAKTGWAVDEVLVIGDTENDLSMIRRFTGFAVTGATREVMEAARKTYKSVGEMLLDNM